MLMASAAPVYAQAIEMRPAIANLVPDQGDPPTVNPPALDPPVFIETSSGSPGIGLTDDEYARFNELSTDLADNLNRKDEIKDEFEGLSNALIGGYAIGTAVQRPGESNDDFAARAARQDALKTEWNTLNDENRDINAELKPLAKKIQRNTNGVRCADQLTPAIYGVSVAGAALSLAGTIAEAATSPTSPVGGEVASNIITAIGHGLDVTSLGLEGVANTLPNCEGVFTGTVQTYANFISKMGLSAFDGAITLGYNGNPTYDSAGQAIDPLQYYYAGITLGGGGLAGAGNGSTYGQAYTGHVDAIAIGNGARAESEFSTAIGTGAIANAVGSTAIGAFAHAQGINSTAVGFQSHAEGESSVAIGDSSHAVGTSSIAIGDTSIAGGVNGIAIGTGNNSGTGANNTAIGSGITIMGGGNNSVIGVGHAVNGANNFVAGDPDEVVGTGNTVTGNDNFVAGLNNQVLGNNNGTLGAVAGLIQGDELPGVRGNNNSVIGSGNAIGTGSTNGLNGPITTGDLNKILGDGNTIVDTRVASPGAVNNSILGNANTVNGDRNVAIGYDNNAVGSDAVAIGSGADATGNGNIAIGLSAIANALNTTAVGQSARALASNSSAFGRNATVNTGANNSLAVGNSATVQTNDENATAIGAGATVNADQGTALGQGASVGAGADNSTAIGQSASVTTGSTAALAVGQDATATGDNATAMGQSSLAVGNSTTAVGQNASVTGAGSTAVGTGASATLSLGSTVTGAGASANASVFSSAYGVGSNANFSLGSTAAGAFSSVAGTSLGTANGAGATVAALTEGGTATGAEASTGADNASAYGRGSSAAGENSTAIGTGARALASGSAAFGNGAVASLSNQQVFGTRDNTYTAPGITSDESRNRQSGPLQLTTTDMAGNLAADGGDTFTAISRLQAGVAIALAAEAPPLTSTQNFGVRLGWGNYQGDANGVAASAIGVLCRGCFSAGDRITIDGSVGAGWSEFKTYSGGTTVAGRAGLSWGW